MGSARKGRGEIARRFVAVITAFSFMLSLAVPPAAFAEEAPEELFFGAIPSILSTGFFKTEAKKAPGYVYHIGEERIKNSSARSLHELLEQYVPGVSMTYHFFGSLIGQ